MFKEIRLYNNLNSIIRSRLYSALFTFIMNGNFYHFLFYAKRKSCNLFSKYVTMYMKVNLKIIRRFSAKLKNEILKDYIINEKIDIDKIIDDFFGYVYTIVKNGVSISITDEDIEEIVSDVFVAIWKNSAKLANTTKLKPYLTGIAKNVVRNKYRKSELNFSITDYEESLIDDCDIEKITEENEKEKVIQDTLKTIKPEEYKIFILFYYESKSIKEIAKILNFSTSNVKTILHRVRKIIKRNLEDGGYGYER